MRTDYPVILAVLFLACGLGLIFAYGNGTSSMNMAYPVTGSVLQIANTTSGPAALGGALLTSIGLLLLIWAFLWAIVGEIGLISPARNLPKRKERLERQQQEDRVREEHLREERLRANRP